MQVASIPLIIVSVLFAGMFSLYTNSQVNIVKANLSKAKTISQFKTHNQILLTLKQYKLTALVVKFIARETQIHTGNKVISYLRAIQYTVCLPCLSVALYSTINLFTSAWYALVCNIIFSIIIPVLAVRSSLMAKTTMIKLSIADAYAQFGDSLKADSKVDKAFDLVIVNSTGSVKTLFKEFRDEYSSDSHRAMEMFEKKIGDSFAESFCRILKAYEDTGVDPALSINRVSEKAKRKYYMMVKFQKGLRTFKIAGAVCVGVVIVITNVMNDLAASMGDGKAMSGFDSPVFFSILLVMGFYYLLCFLYENI